MCGESVFVWWFGSVQTVCCIFSFSAALAAVCFAYVVTQEGREDTVNAYVRLKQAYAQRKRKDVVGTS